MNRTLPRLTLAHRALALIAVPALALTLASCANPTPNSALLRLHHSAEGDNKQQLAAEITRLCGHTHDGKTPDSCKADAHGNFPTPKTPAPEPLAPGAEGILAVLAEIPQESMPIIIEQFLKYPLQEVIATFDNKNTFNFEALTIPTAFTTTHTEKTPAPTPTVTAPGADDIRGAEAALAEEYAHIYALGVTMAFTDSETQARTEKLIESHQKVIDTLEQLLEKDAYAPTAAPGYDLKTSTQPTNAESARATVKELTDNNAQFWKNTAAQATTPQWRTAALVITGYLSTE
ncbi:DUF4439 domain-containing protein [Corynebacterium felinum]|uniref:DUF4439 domain-containing protein n=1 Tax=Corynebacterium felinum TaxID=131318 RepID=A0ABU2BBE3_9CORY|nr:DUF4439 domain-containing protein [Corynebacterium felinum]MDF5819904.1 DUF4439 domain-containing protein [Corynebacterium felinum]MDR7355952.1 hypothetical protein [Corynebacterium felinum]WJY95290.1 hypothetical protein CFELI_08425 [Corynebacterium felinum]